MEEWPVGMLIAATCGVVGLYVFRYLGYLP
jgi:hypothetical protein